MTFSLARFSTRAVRVAATASSASVIVVNRSHSLVAGWLSWVGNQVSL